MGIKIIKMEQQKEIDFFTATELRDAGIETAVRHANQVHEKWSDQAYKFALDYIKFHTSFQCEDMRLASIGFVPEPPSKRAFGGVIMHLAKEGKITKIGYSSVDNTKAHMAFAAVWKSNLYKG